MYTYYFTLTLAENREKGAYHGSKLWYTCKNIPYSDYSNLTWYYYDYVVERRMYWANFIHNGNPNGDGLPNVIKTTNQTKEAMWLGNYWGAGPLSFQDKRLDFIERWYATLKEW